MNTQGYKWGIFTARVPFLHMRIEVRELVQGLIVSLSTGMALVPLLMSGFGLTFEEAVTISMIHTMLVTSNLLLFGEPFAGGWVTPALPFTLAFVMGGYDSPAERFQMMTALSLDFAALLLLLGVTGFGQKVMDFIAPSIKAGVILGAALAAIKRVFYNDFDRFQSMPWAMSVALLTCLVFFFLPVFQKLKAKNKLIAFIASFGLLPGFILAGVFGTVFDELHFDIQHGILIPPLGDLMNKVSPFAIGWPPVDFFIAALPLACITYLILFGDLLTGIALIKDNQKHRPDDVIDINLNRSHYAGAIRNFIMALIAPFFPTQGTLWSGVQIIIIQRWVEGRDKMQTLYSGIAAYYYYGIPILVLWLPVITFLKPFMPIALMLTLVLTGVACAKLSFRMAVKMNDRVIMAVVALTLVYFWG
jgi:hypothetical protein